MPVIFVPGRIEVVANSLGLAYILGLSKHLKEAIGSSLPIHLFQIDAPYHPHLQNPYRIDLEVVQIPRDFLR